MLTLAQMTWCGSSLCFVGEPARTSDPYAKLDLRGAAKAMHYPFIALREALKRKFCFNGPFQDHKLSLPILIRYFSVINTWMDLC